MYFISNEGSKTVKPKPVTKPPAKKASAPIQSKPVLSTKVVKKVIPVQPYVFSQLFYSFPREMIPMFFVNGICCSCWAMPWVVISDVIIASDLFMFRNGGVVSGKVKMNYLKEGHRLLGSPKMLSSGFSEKLCKHRRWLKRSARFRSTIQVTSSIRRNHRFSRWKNWDSVQAR